MGYNNHVVLSQNGFEALTLIIKHCPNVIIIEEDLPNLNAKDIIKALLFKGIKAKIIVIGLKAQISIKLNSTQTIRYINVNNNDFVDQILSLVNKELITKV